MCIDCAAQCRSCHQKKHVRGDIFGEDSEGAYMTAGSPPRYFHSKLNNVNPQFAEAMDAADILSLRMGHLLRNKPIARLVVVAYLVLLHLWVMVVMHHSMPDINASNMPAGH